jgi:diguanylate cyclase (GGDEF)-like protein
MSKPSILLIDPFKNLLDAYQMIFEKEYCQVQTANNLDEAFHWISINQFSVIITEYLLPFEETHRMIRLIKQNTPEAYIIMVTNIIIDEVSYEKLFMEGIDDIILKPYSPEKIIVHIKKGLRQRDLILQKQEIERQSLIDPIAQKVKQLIFNSIFLKKCLRQELKKANRHRHPFSLILITLPTKENIGDRFEACYMELVKIIRKYIREEDMVGKNNGEIGVILPETDQIGSQAAVQRLSNLIHTHPYFSSDDALKSNIQNLSFQSFTYPGQSAVPEYLKNILDELRREKSFN